MKYESPLSHLITISLPYKKAVSPKYELDSILEKVTIPVKEVVAYEDVFIPVNEPTNNAVKYEGKWCVAALRASILVEGEYTPDEIYQAFGGTPEKIRVFVDYIFD